MDNPLVTVCIFAYNHENFILRAVNSVLAQVTDFDFKILIGEDGSQDRTPEILNSLKLEYPDKIEIIFQDQSKKIYINGRPTARYNLYVTLMQAKGKYTALLDGDDYWTDPYKLQRQVDILEGDNTVSMVIHNAEELRGDKKSKIIKSLENGYLDSDNIILRKFRIPTLSMVFRRNLISIEPVFFEILSGDRYIELQMVSSGNVFYIDEVMGVKNTHSGSIITGFNKQLLQVAIRKYQSNLMMLSIVKRSLHSAFHIYLSQLALKVFRLNPLKNQWFIIKAIQHRVKGFYYHE